MIKRNVFVFFVLILLSSCFGGRTQPSNFYNIVSIDSNVKIKVKNNMIATIELVSIPGYLDRSEIVSIKEDETQINISEFNRWAEPLSSSIQRVITDNVSKYVPNAVIRPVNLFRQKYNYSVLIYINRFEGKFNDKVYLDAWYSIIDNNGTNVANERVNFDIDVESDYNDLVQKMSVLLSKLSENISKKLSKL